MKASRCELLDGRSQKNSANPSLVSENGLLADRKKPRGKPHWEDWIQVARAFIGSNRRGRKAGDTSGSGVIYQMTPIRCLNVFLGFEGQGASDRNRAYFRVRAPFDRGPNQILCRA